MSAVTALPAETTDLVSRLREQLIDSAGLDEILDPEPLVHPDILFLDSIAWVVGKPGHFKSFVQLDLAGCVGTGQNWQGNRVTPGNVLYLVAEGVRGIKKRVRAWETAMGTAMTNVHFLPVAIQAGHAAQWAAFCELAVELKPVLIVIDTQARITVGIEENSNSEMGLIIDRIERLRQATGACVALVHHIGRNGDTGRGATALDGAVSTIVKVTKDGEKVTLECQKSKDGADWTPIDLRAVPTADSIVLVPHDGHTDPAASHTAAMRSALTWWEHHRDAWVSKSDLVDVVAPRTTMYRHLNELIELGYVEATTPAKPNSPKKFRLRRQPPGADS
jgi:hypothetical protein